MDTGIFGLAMYGALKRDDNANNRFVETKKGLVTLEDLIKFYEEYIDERKSEKETKLQEQPEVESVPKKTDVKTRKLRPRDKKETL